MTDTVRVTNTLRSALTVAPEPRERMQRFETGRNDETDTYYVASTDRTVLISQIDRAAREVALAATPAPLDDDGWQERGNPGDDATPPAPLDVERECEHRRTTPCIDRNGSCGTHRSPWAGDAEELTEADHA